MNDNDEFINNNESGLRKDNMFLPIHVETEEEDPDVPRIKDKPKVKTVTLSPVLLSPGSTTKKLIESGKIKHCVILLQKASLDPSYVQAFTDMRKDASSPGILPREGESSPSLGDQVETTEATPLTDNGVGAESEGAGHPITSRNIFASFYHEWPATKTECEADIDSSDKESLPESVGENASNQDTSLKDIVERSQSVGSSKIDDDAMSVSSTGSRETAVYPIHAREDTPEMYELMTDDETMSANTESDYGDLDEEPPCLERLESLPAPGHCLDHPPVLSPRVLFGASDFYPLGGTDPVSQPELDSEAPELFGHAPDGSIDMPIPAEVMSVADNCELDEDASPENPPGTEQFDPRQSSCNTEVSVTCSTDRTEKQTDKTDQIQQTSSTESEQQREQRQNALKNVINDVFLSHPSSGTEEVFSNEENSSDNLQDSTNTAVTEKDHGVGNEYEDMLQQIADTTKRINSDDGDQEVLYSEGAPEKDSGVTEIVSLGEGISTIPQENFSKDAPNVGVTQEQSHDITEQSSVTSLDLPDANVGSNNPSPDNASSPQSLESSQHTSLTRTDSQTEPDKADRPQHPETNRTRDDQENVLDANIEVAEVVIDSHVYDPHSHPDSVGVMFPLDLRTCIDNENDTEQDPDQNVERDKQTHFEQTKAECTMIDKTIHTNSVSSMKEVASLRDEKSHNTNDSGENEISNPNCSVVPDVSSVSGLPSMNSEEQTKAPRPDAERKRQEETEALSNSPNLHGPQNGEEESLGPQTVPRASSESNECTMILGSVTDAKTRINKPVQNPPSSQDVATFSADRPQDGSNTGESIAGGFDQTLRRTLKTHELDIALSLAFMSEITASNKPQKTATSGNVTSASMHSPLIFVPVSQLDMHQRGDVRIRHQSAPKASVENRQEESPEANAKRPHSTHGPTTQAVVAPSEVRNNFQQAKTQFDRGVAQDRNSSEFNFPAVSSNSTTLQTGKCDELIWRLTQTQSQKQNLHPERGHPGNTPQQTKMPHLTHLKAAALQHEPSIPPKQLQGKESHRGIPIQLPIDKRFLPSNLDATDYPQVGINSKRGNGHSEAPIENRYVITPNHAAGFGGPGVTFPQQLAKNSTPKYQIAQPTSITTVKSHSTNQQEGRTQGLRSPQTTESTVPGLYPVNRQQRLLITTPHQTPSFVPAVLNAPPLSPKRVVYLPDQPHTVLETNQAPVRNIPGVAVTQPTIIVMQPTNNVATVVSKAPVVLQADRLYNQSVRSRSPQNPNGTFLPKDNSIEVNPMRQKETTENRRGNIYLWNPQQEQQPLFVSSGSSATIPNVHRSVAGTPTTNFSELETLRQYAARNNEYHHSQKSLQPAVSTPSVQGVYMHQNESVLKGRNCGPLTRAQPTEQTMAQTLTQPTLMNLSASAYIGDLAKATRSRAANAASPSAQATFHPQVIQPPTNIYQTVLNIDSNTSNRERGDTNEAFGEQPSRSDSAMDDPKQKACSYIVPTSLESDATYAAHDDVRLTKPASTTASQDRLPTTECWTQAEKALLKSLPEQLSNYLVKQRRTLGIRLEESLKAVLTSLLSEEEEEKSEETGETRRETTRVWHSTIHHRATDATSLSDKETSLSPRELTRPTDVPTSRPTPPVQNAAQNQGSDRGLTEALQQDNNAHQRQLGRPSAKSALRFYNPAPSLTPLMNPDVVSDRVDNRVQGDTGNSQGNTDSAVDLTIKASRKTPQLTHDGIAATEHNAMFPNYTPAIGNLYPRAYSAGQAGPIMPSSYVPTSAASLKRHNLTSAQLLIRDRLLERRHRIQSRSISTPDIVHGWEYPNSRKRKRDMEPTIQPAKVPSPGNPPASSHTECEIIYHPVTAPSNTVEAIGSADDAAHKEIPSENVRDLTSTDGREFVVREASSLTQYPKMKSSLQNRWVIESVQPSTLPSTNDKKEQNPPSRDFLSGVNGIRAEQRLTQDQPSNITTAISPGIQISYPVEPVTTTASDPSAVKTTSILVQVVEKAPGIKVSRTVSRPEQAKESKGPTKDKVKDLLINSFVSCQFCSFRSYTLSDVRLHVKREHFSKYEKKNVSTSKQTKRFDAGRPIANIQDAQAREVMSDATKTVNVRTKGTLEPSVDKGSASNGATLVETCAPASQAGFVSPHHGVRSQGHPDPPAVRNVILVASSNTGLPAQPGTTTALLHAANGIQTVNAAPVSVTSQAMLSPSITSKPLPNLTELADEQLSCSHCKLQFTNSKDLHFHVKFQHTDTKGLHMCFNCGYTAKTKYGLRKHILRWHTQEKGQANSVYKCPHKKCDESFGNIHELHRHSMTHDAKSKYECDLCGAKYRNINGLRYHKIRHNLNYPHQCKQCGLNFKTMGVLHRHELQTKHFGS